MIKVNTTLREVIGGSFDTQTQKKSDDSKSQQTDSGDKREFVAGIDVSDIPDNMSKSEFKEYLAKKGKLLEDGYVPKFKEVAEYKKERDAMLALGLTTQEAGKIIREHIAARDNKNKSDVKQDLKSEIDQLKEEAPDLETRKGVERLERIIKQLSKESPEFKELKERLDKAEKALGYVQNKTITSRVESLNKDLDELSGERFDKDFIEKYREKVITIGKQYPDASVRELIKAAATSDDYDEALLKTKKKEESKERNIKEKINANDSASSGVTGKEKEMDVKKTSMKQLLSHVFTQKK